MKRMNEYKKYCYERFKEAGFETMGWHDEFQKERKISTLSMLAEIHEIYKFFRDIIKERECDENIYYKYSALRKANERFWRW